MLGLVKFYRFVCVTRKIFAVKLPSSWYNKGNKNVLGWSSECTY